MPLGVKDGFTLVRTSHEDKQLKLRLRYGYFETIGKNGEPLGNDWFKLSS